MEMLRSACGIYDCEACEHKTGGNCLGCSAGNRLLTDSGEKACGVIACVESRGAESCNGCGESSCLLRRSVESICPMRSRFENARWWAGRMARALEPRKRNCCEAGKEEIVSDRVVNRLRWYLTALDSFTQEGITSLSSWQLAERVGVNAALIRKDLSKFGEFGTPSFGYRIDYLTQRIRSILHLDEPSGVIWIGAACFRLHCSSVSRLGKHACKIFAVLDTDPNEIGARVGDYEVLPVDRLVEIMSNTGIQIAALALRGPEAAVVARTLAGLGIKAILNISGELLALPDSVRVVNMDLVGELLELSYYCK